MDVFAVVLKLASVLPINCSSGSTQFFLGFKTLLKLELVDERKLRFLIDCILAMLSKLPLIESRC